MTPPFDSPSPNPTEGQNPRRFCGAFIHIVTDGWAGTYCKLLSGHEGEHSAHYPPAIHELGEER